MVDFFFFFPDLLLFRNQWIRILICLQSRWYWHGKIYLTEHLISVFKVQHFLICWLWKNH